MWGYVLEKLLLSFYQLKLGMIGNSGVVSGKFGIAGSFLIWDVFHATKQSCIYIIKWLVVTLIMGV